MNVAVEKCEPRYPPPPFHPSERYPEYPYPAQAVAREPNGVYAAVRQALADLGLDRGRFGTAAWNPLGELVGDGRRVLLKPNFVNHYHPVSDDRVHFEALVTHGAVIRPILDYVYIASRGRAAVSVVDLPIQSADLAVLCQRTGLRAVVDFAETHGFPVEVLDLRTYRLVADRSGAVIGRETLAGDSRGYVTVDLGGASSLVPLEKDARSFGAPDYEGDATERMHSGGRHQYVLPRTVLDAGLIINLPKLKVHCKAGLTSSLKNLVGVIGDKSCLPHYRRGGPRTGGDEVPAETSVDTWRSRYSYEFRKRGRLVWRLARPLGRTLARLNRLVHGSTPLVGIVNGNWYGNDTIWRMVHDLNRVVFHADRDGMLHKEPQRRYLAVIDGVVGGEGEGPLRPEPVPSGLIVAGTDPLATDVCCAGLMGLDWRKIPLLSRYDPDARHAFSGFKGNPAEVTVISADPAVGGHAGDLRPVHRFKPAAGWVGHMECDAGGDLA